jgi:AraC family transcriptional regulator, transcriptional activator of pobA
MTTVPRFALYGTEQAPAWADLVHLEHIPERSSRYNWEIDPHVHEALLQVLYVRRASAGGEALMDERVWPITAPCLIVIPAGVVHGFHFRDDTDGPVITAAQRPLESLVAAIAPELLAHIRRPQVVPVDQEGRFAGSLLPLFDAIERESRYAATGQVAAGMSLLAALFVQVARISESAAAANMSDPRSRKASQIEQFRLLLDRQFRSQRSVEHYAAALGVTAGHLGRLCREVLGMSPLDAINARILHEAQRELVYSTLSVKQVAKELGFDDEAYFGRFFKKQTGQRPTEFREMARGHLARS